MKRINGLRVNMISIVVPVCKMAGAEANFLFRNLKSIREQTYKDVEVIVTDNSDDNNLKQICSLFPDLNIKHSFNPIRGMAQNTNAGIKLATGDLIKFLYMDDYLAHENALKDIVNEFKGEWLITGNTHYNGEHIYNPRFASVEGIMNNINTVGSPSVLTIKRHSPSEQLLFDENMTWLLDVDYYKRLYKKYGEPTVLDDINIVIGTGEHQATHWRSESVV